MPRVSPWWTGELGQSNAINDLDDELEYERAARLRQARRLEAVQSDLRGGLDRVDSRIGSVADRIETVLSWTELRFQLIEFDEYEARKEIRKTVRALAQGRRALMPDTGDVPDYWLPPAAAAVLPLVLRDRADAAVSRAVAFTDLKTGLENARERDEVRAELFNLAVGRCFGQPALIEAAVLRLLGAPVDLGLAASGEVAAAWRVLWEHAALGEFGPAAADQLRTLLQDRFDTAALDPAALEAWDRAASKFGAGDGAARGPAASYDALADHFVAVRDTVHNGVETLAADPPRMDAPGTDTLRTDPPGPDALGGHGATEYTAPTYTTPTYTAPDPVAEPASDTAASPEPGDADEHEDHVWRVYLQELIEEPSPAELPLVREMEALELGGAPSRTSPSWAAPAGTVADLLRRDLFDPKAPIPLRRLALDLAAPLLRSRLETPAPAPEPAVVAVNRRRVKVDVTAAGHDPDKTAQVERRLSGNIEDPPSKVLPGAIVAVLGALAVTLAIASQWFVAVLFALLTAVPYLWHRARTREHDALVSDRDDKLAELHAALLAARDEAAALDARAAERHAAAEEARARLLAVLP